MIDVEAEVNKHKNCKDRAELERQIQYYKNLALQYAANLTLAGGYSKVVRKLQEICERLPAPNLIKYPSGTRGANAKTASITSEEQAKIKADWKKRTKR